MNRLAKRITFFAALPLAGVVIVLSAAFTWLLASESGTRWLAKRVLPATLSYRELSGTLSQGLRIQGLSLRLDGVDVDIKHIEGRWQLLSILGGQFHLESLAAADVEVRLKDTDKPDQPPGPWPSLRLPFPVTLKRVAVENVQIHQGDSISEIRTASLSGVLSPLHAHIHQISVEIPNGKISLSGRIGTSYPYPSTLGLAWWLDQAEQHFAGEGSVSGPLTSLRIEHQVTSPLQLATTGDIETETSPEVMTIDPAQVSFDLGNHWQNLDLTPYGVSASSSGSLELVGSPTNYVLTLDTRLTTDVALARKDDPVTQGTPGPLSVLLRNSASPPHLTLRALGNLERAQIAILELETGQGKANLEGTVDWVEGVHWDAILSAQDLDTSALMPEFPTRLSASISSTGHWAQGRLATALNITQLTGSFRNHPLDGHGRINIHYGDGTGGADIDDLQLALGGNKLALSGVVGTQSDLKWGLTADNISALAPGMGGRVRGSGSVSGSLNDLLVHANLDGAEFRAADAKIETLSLRVNPSSAGEHRLELEMVGISGAGLNKASLLLKGQGSPQNHRLHAAFAAPGNAAGLSLQGGFRDGAWQGSLSQLEITESPVGTWELTDPAQLYLATDSIRLSEACLVQRDSRLCTSISKQDGDLTAQGQVAALDMALAQTWLPQEASVQGRLDGSFDFRSTDDGRFRGGYQLQSGQGLLRYTGAGERSFESAFSVTAKGNIANDILSNHIQLNIAETGNVALRLAAGLDAPHRLEGSLTADLPSLEWLQAFTTRIEDPAGRVDIALLISGDLSAPQLSGELALDGLTLTLPAAGIRLHDGNGRLVVSPGNQWQLQATIQSGTEPLSVFGNGILGTGKDNIFELLVQGTNVILVDLPDTRVAVSPDLRVALTDSVLNIRGDLGIPTAHLIIRPQPEGATTVSRDEEVMPPETVDSDALAVNADIRIQLGKAVHLEAFGLDTRLTGNLRVQQHSPNPPRANGTIALEDGIYEAYGQKLEVTRGLLLFQGAVDNPGLNIVAVRDTPSATVGLEIGGSAQDIKSQVFSDPAMPSTDALTILVTGKPLADLNESDTNAVANIATSLGIAQSHGITNRLQSATGLDVVSLQGGDSYVDSSLVVGKYLSSKLFISYVQNLFTPQGSFVLQYTLGKRLGLKAESGEYQSIDLLYRIEH